MKEIQHHLYHISKPGIPAATLPLQEPINPLRSFEFQMKKLKAGHARVLAIWAVLNLLSGGVFIFICRHQPFWLHFQAMNASWGLVNLGVSAFLYFHHNEIFKAPQSLLQQMDHQRHAEKMMVFNLGLDLTFVAIGWGLWLYTGAPDLIMQELWKGFGVAVMMQGSFLGMLDGVFHCYHVKNRKKVYPSWKSLVEKL